MIELTRRAFLKLTGWGTTALMFPMRRRHRLRPATIAARARVYVPLIKVTGDTGVYSAVYTEVF